MFKPDQCKRCGACLSGCQWMDVPAEKAGQYMEEMINGKNSPILSNCITCYSCNERCPQQANPYGLFLELQETYNTFFPQETITFFENDYQFEGSVNAVPKSDRILTTCSIEKTNPELLQGRLYDIPKVGGKAYNCWPIFPHMNAKQIQIRELKNLIARLSDTGAKEVICFHADCYSALAKTAPEHGIDVPFKPVHLAEYFIDFLINHQNEIKKSNINIAYQRPCTSKLTPEAESYIDTVFDLIGVNRVKRKYDRKNALCCSSLLALHNRKESQNCTEKNINDAIDAGAQAMVYLCPICRDMLEETAKSHAMPLIFLGDLVRMAIGEIDPIPIN